MFSRSVHEVEAGASSRCTKLVVHALCTEQESTLHTFSGVSHDAAADSALEVGAGDAGEAVEMVAAFGLVGWTLGSRLITERGSRGKQGVHVELLALHILLL